MPFFWQYCWCDCCKRHTSRRKKLSQETHWDKQGTVIRDTLEEVRDCHKRHAIHASRMHFSQEAQKHEEETVTSILVTRAKMHRRMRVSQEAEWRDNDNHRYKSKSAWQKVSVTRGRMKRLHRKKRFTSFPSPAGKSLTKLPLGRNNSVMTSLFPPRESLVVTSRLGTGNSRTFFLRCMTIIGYKSQSAWQKVSVTRGRMKRLWQS
jgi:hypothetical protein